MDLKQFIKSKKFKNILITVCEILVVAGIIFGALMYLQYKVNQEADKASGLSGTGTDEKKNSQKVDRMIIILK